MEYPKWVYPAGVKEKYEAGEEPYLIYGPESEEKVEKKAEKAIK